MGHRLSRIYTRTGDDGSTGLGDGMRVPKEHLRVEAYGTVDEANSAVGVVLALPGLPEAVVECLTGVQHDLFDLGGELCMPGYRVMVPADVERLEEALDHFNDGLPPLKDFILPGGSPAAAACHVARTVVRRVEGPGEGRAAFIRQLAWREFYAHLLVAFPETRRRAMRPEYDGVAWRRDPEGLAAWAEGRTGYPFVDAAMRQLRAEGWVHNRARMMAASFLVKDLLVDWRLGERHFLHWLVDGDPAQNVGNWQWVAGTGADAAPYFRVFNPVAQGRRFDADGAYVRRWVPELARLEAPAIHAPWEAPAGVLAGAGVTLGIDYPWPLVDHAEARAATIAAYEAAKRLRPA